MSKYFNHAVNLTAWREFYSQVISPRKVRNIVTVSGRCPRGRFPSYKAPEGAKYESLGELDFLRVLEVSTLVQSFETQPCVFQLTGEKPIRYTPDARADILGQQVFFEVKHDGFRKSERTSARVKEISIRMSGEGIRFAVVLASELREQGLQQTLKDLLRYRPAPRRYRSVPDVTQWDPLGRKEPNAQMLRRWCDAQRECDALINRIMGRNSDGLFVETE